MKKIFNLLLCSVLAICAFVSVSLTKPVAKASENYKVDTYVMQNLYNSETGVFVDNSNIITFENCNVGSVSPGIKYLNSSLTKYCKIEDSTKISILLSEENFSMRILCVSGTNLVINDENYVKGSNGIIDVDLTNFEDSAIIIKADSSAVNGIYVIEIYSNIIEDEEKSEISVTLEEETNRTTFQTLLSLGLFCLLVFGIVCLVLSISKKKNKKISK